MGDSSCRMISLKCLVIVLAATLIHHCAGHTYGPGKCPSIEPIRDFDMTKVKISIFSLIFQLYYEKLSPLECSSSDDGMPCKKRPQNRRV